MSSEQPSGGNFRFACLVVAGLAAGTLLLSTTGSWYSVADGYGGSTHVANGTPGHLFPTTAFLIWVAIALSGMAGVGGLLLGGRAAASRVSTFVARLLMVVSGVGGVAVFYRLVERPDLRDAYRFNYQPDNLTPTWFLVGPIAALVAIAVISGRLGFSLRASRNLRATGPVSAH